MRMPWDCSISWVRQWETRWGGGAQANNPLVQAIVQQLGQGGGLAGLVQTFQKNGLADIVNSWVGTGANLPISPQQIQQGLGNDLLKQLAAKAGILPEVAGSQLAALSRDWSIS